MRQIFVIVFLVILANFIFWSISFSQNGVSIGGTVRETEANKNSPKLQQTQSNTETVKPTTKENKYLYFFEKNYFKEDQPEMPTQTIYDKVSSYLLMCLVMITSAVFLLLILRFFDQVFHHKE